MWLKTSLCQTPLLGVNHIFLSVTKLLKTAQTLQSINKLFLEITLEYQNYVQIFTDDSKVDERVVTAAVSCVASNSLFSCRLRDHCSDHTAELRALFFFFKEKPTVCAAFDNITTILHILIECADQVEVRKKYFEEKSLYLLFQNADPEKYLTS